MRSPRSLLQAEPPQLSLPFLIGEVFQPLDHLCGPPLDPLQHIHVLLVLRTPDIYELTPSQPDPIQSEVKKVHESCIKLLIFQLEILILPIFQGSRKINEICILQAKDD